MIIIHAHIIVKPNCRKVFLEQVQNLITSSQEEEGNYVYELYEDTKQANAFVMLEKWKDQASVEKHNQAPHFIQFGGVAKDLLQEPLRIETYEVTATL